MHLSNICVAHARSGRATDAHALHAHGSPDVCVPAADDLAQLAPASPTPSAYCRGLANHRRAPTSQHAGCVVTTRHFVSHPHTAHAATSLAHSSRLAFRAAAFVPVHSRLCCLGRRRQPIQHCGSDRRRSQRPHRPHLRPRCVRGTAPPC